MYVLSNNSGRFQIALLIEPAIQVSHFLGSTPSKWVERLAADEYVAAVLCSIQALPVTGESEGRQMKRCWRKVIYEYTVIY